MQTELSEENKDLIPVKFHFYKLKFSPYTHSKKETSHTILHQVVTFLSQEQ